jgi:superoxide dismutase, Fe-Mn family
MHTSSATLERPHTSHPKYAARRYEHLLGMEGFSDKLLTNHFKLYQGYVTNANLMYEEINHLFDAEKEKSPQYSELKRRIGWELNGMRLHEYYFDNLGGTEKLAPGSELAKLMTTQFGSVERWKKDFIATGAMRGIGWAVLYQDPNTGLLLNLWIEEHNANHLVGGTPLLIMDVYEHAFMIDYGTDKSKYIQAFFKNINWEIVEMRCASANQ